MLMELLPELREGSLPTLCDSSLTPPPPHRIARTPGRPFYVRIIELKNTTAAEARLVIGIGRNWSAPRKLLPARMRGNRQAGAAVIPLRAAAASDVPKTRTSRGIRKRKILSACLIQSTSVTTATRSHRERCSTPILKSSHIAAGSILENCVPSS